MHRPELIPHSIKSPDPGVLFFMKAKIITVCPGNIARSLNQVGSTFVYALFRVRILQLKGVGIPRGWAFIPKATLGKFAGRHDNGDIFSRTTVGRPQA